MGQLVHRYGQSVNRVRSSPLKRFQKITEKDSSHFLAYLDAVYHFIHAVKEQFFFRFYVIRSKSK